MIERNMPVPCDHYLRRAFVPFRDLPERAWRCLECGAVNSVLDRVCQYCPGAGKIEDEIPY